MNTEPTIYARAEQPTASIPERATFKEWGRVNALVEEIFAWIAQRGIEPAGPLFYRYWVQGDMDRPFELEVGVPVAQPVQGDDRVQAGIIPAGEYAVLTHIGHPDSMEQSHLAVQDWVKQRGRAFNNHHDGQHEMWGGCFEFYLTDPEEEPDLNKWSIQLAYLLAPAS